MTERTRWVTAVIAVVCLLTLGTWAIAGAEQSGPSGSDDPGTAPADAAGTRPGADGKGRDEKTASPNGEPRSDEPQSTDEATEEVGDSVTALVAQVTDVVSLPPKQVPGTLEKAATARFTDELMAQADQNKENDVKVVGRARVISLEVRDLVLETSPATAEVVVCVDNSRVRVVGPRGLEVQRQLHPRSRQLYHLIRTDDGWRIDQQGFPKNPNCES